MRIILTGAAGFVGAHLKAELEKCGHEVVGLDIKKSAPVDIICDLSDEKILKDILDAHRPDVIAHLAAMSRVDFDDYSYLYKANIWNTINILSVIKALRLKTKFFFVSSALVYGNFDSSSRGLIDENSPIAPVNHYGASKASCEHIVSAFCNESKNSYVIARPFNHTGVGQTKYFIIPKLVEAFLNKAESINLGNINVVREFLDVRDVVVAYRLLIEDIDNFSGNVFNVCSGRGYCIRDIISMLEAITGHKIKINIDSSLIRKTEIPLIVGSFNKLKSKTGWEPSHTIEETLRWMLNS